MALVAPDILDAARELSWLYPVAGLALGLLLWLLGGWHHRFWLVLCMTSVGGVLGLCYGAAYGLQPLVAGLLLAVAAGALALSLVRVMLFLAGGVAAVWLAHVVAPSWNEPAVCFLAGGLAGVLLYKVWMAALTSLAGTLLTAYSILCLVDKLVKGDMVAWADQQAPVLNWACAAFAVLGLLVQFLLERRRIRREAEKKASKKQAAEERAAPPPPPPPPPPAKPWWAALMPGKGMKKAG